MKLNTQAFPYPVLTNDEGAAADYKDGAFQCSLIFGSEVNQDNKFDIEYAFILSNEDIQTAIDNGDASFALDDLAVVPVVEEENEIFGIGIHNWIALSSSCIASLTISSIDVGDISPSFSLDSLWLSSVDSSLFRSIILSFHS